MEEITKSIPVLITVKQRYDQCKEGYMEEVNPEFALLTYPQLYPHKCNNCGCVENYTKSYPYSQVISEAEYNKIMHDKA